MEGKTKMKYELQTSLVHWGFQSWFEMWDDYWPPIEPDDNSIQLTLQHWMK